MPKSLHLLDLSATQAQSRCLPDSRRLHVLLSVQILGSHELQAIGQLVIATDEQRDDGLPKTQSHLPKLSLQVVLSGMHTLGRGTGAAVVTGAAVGFVVGFRVGDAVGVAVFAGMVIEITPSTPWANLTGRP